MNFEKLKKAILSDFSETSVFEVFEEGIDKDYLESITGKFFIEESYFDSYDGKYVVVYFKDYNIYVRFTYINNSYSANNQCLIEEVFPEKINKKIYKNNNISFEQIKSFLSNNYDRVASYFLFNHNYNNIKEEIENFCGNVELSDKFYDSYNEGDVYIILHFVNSDMYLKIKGYNDSYSGVYWNNVVEVEKNIQTVISFNEKNDENNPF